MKIVLSLLLICAAGMALADQVYEVIDANGHKTFTDKAPFNTKEQVKKVDIHDVNIAEPAHQAVDNESYFDKQEAEEKVQQQQINQRQEQEQQAKQAVDDAKAALDKAKEVQAGDFFNNKNGGLHYKSSYTERVEAAQAQYEKAQQHYQAVLQSLNAPPAAEEPVDETPK